MTQHLNTSELKTILQSSLLNDEVKELSGFPDMKLLRFSTAGIVDDGKSTLIGRLLYDSKSIFEDQLQSLTADVAIVLIDARNGIVEQTKRRIYIASLLQIPHVILAINKMDLVNFSEEVYNTIKNEFEKIATILKLKQIYFIPISARDGDNVVEVSKNTAWYNGETLLNLLETIPVHNNDSELPARFPVQSIIHQDNDKFHDYRGYAGRVSGGVFRVGDTILALPSNRLSTIKAINEGPDELSEAFTPQSVTIRLDVNMHIARGEMLVKLNVKYPKYSSIISLHICWLNARPLSIGAKYILRHTTDETQATITDIRYKVNINTLENIEDDKTVLMNDIAHITIETLKPLKYDDYSENRITGSLVLIDEKTFETVGAGMIVSDEEVYSYNI